jgi:iron complex transport system substrate-binding protein
MSEIHASREDAKARRDIEEVAAIVVDGQLIVELKSVENIHPVHPKQLLTYLRLMNLALGLLINFGAPLLKDGLQRVVNKHTNFASSRLRVHQQEAQS